MSRPKRRFSLGQGETGAQSRRKATGSESFPVSASLFSSSESNPYFTDRGFYVSNLETMTYPGQENIDHRHHWSRRGRGGGDGRLVTIYVISLG